MYIYDMTINHFTTPIGYVCDDASFGYKVGEAAGDFLTAHSLEVAADERFTQLIYTTEKVSTDKSLFSGIQLALAPRTRYWWRVTAWTDIGAEVSGVSWFETGKLSESWSGTWVSVKEDTPSLVFSRKFNCEKKVRQARVYLCGLGLYEAFINGKKVGDEFLTPGYNNYHEWIQYQSYDVTGLIDNENEMTVMLGKGWYLGNFGFHGGTDHIYGEQIQLMGELHLQFEDGTESMIVTDNGWQARSGQIGENSIYYGEDRDDSRPVRPFTTIEVSGPTEKLQERLSTPVSVVAKCQVQEILTGAELILDLGQNMVGWLVFKNRLPKGTKVTFEFAETLIHGQFFRDNLRAARAAFEYVSDGVEKQVRPQFTFYGFRYVRISGWPEQISLVPTDFEGWVLSTAMTDAGDFVTSNDLVNRLYQNIKRSQRGNFIEVPMDCPQRDERMGWTGDAQIFSKTALFNSDAYAFFQKYGYDMLSEQKNHDGAPTMTIPDVPSDIQSSGVANAVWGDAATIIPWNVYQVSGDPRILRQQFSSMVSWLDYIASRAFKDGLWVGDFQFGDWLALDGADPQSPLGGTEAQFVANVYYLHSLELTAQTALILGEADRFSEQAARLRAAIRKEYFTGNGRLAMDTQTGYLLTLHFDLVTEDERPAIIQKLRERLEKDDYHLQTGFVGTPLINVVLSECGLDDLAYALLLNDDLPSWLYEVKMGATTIWERWNSILPNGDINPEGMNSLNHYAYGAIGEWFYGYVLGMQNQTAGFGQVRIQPHLHWSIPRLKGSYLTPNGRISLAVSMEKDKVEIQVTVPFNTSVTLQLPRLSIEEVVLTQGSYVFVYPITAALVRNFTGEMTFSELLSEPIALVRMKRRFKGRKILSSSSRRDNGNQPLSRLVAKGLLTITELADLLAELNTIAEETASI